MDFFTTAITALILILFYMKITSSHLKEKNEKLHREITRLETAREKNEAEKILRQEWFKSTDVRDTKNQLELVSNNEFSKKPLMNKSEFRVFAILEQWMLRNPGNGWRLFAQVCLGEYLSTQEDDAHKSINSKRCDFLIIDSFGHALVAIEYQGTGHDQMNAKDRDKVKAIALGKAGVQLVEVFPRDSKAQILNKIETSLSLETA